MSPGLLCKIVEKWFTMVYSEAYSETSILGKTFSLFSTISPNHKWNGTRLLLESECTSCRTTFTAGGVFIPTQEKKTYNLRKLENMKKVLEIFVFDGKVPSRPPKSQILTFFSEKSQNISCKTLHRKTCYFASFREFVSILCPWLLSNI